MSWFRADHAEQGALMLVGRQIIQHDACFDLAVPFEPYLFHQAGSMPADGKSIIGQLTNDYDNYLIFGKFLHR